MASLRDIASELGVSVSLVSKVLNDRLGTTGVREELVERIREKAREVGYQKNHNALSLLAKRQNAFAVFLHRHGAKGTNFAEELLEGIAQKVRGTNLRMILHFFTELNEFEEKISDLHSGIVDGIIVSGVLHMELIPHLYELRGRRLNVVTLYNGPIRKEFPNVGLSDEEITRCATRHLIDRGCRRIVHFDTLAERTRGYRKALKEAGIRFDSKLLLDCRLPKESSFGLENVNLGFTREIGADRIGGLLDRGVAFDGVCAQSDGQALGALHCLRERGMRVPQEVKITGVDDSPFCELISVPLTSVSQNYKQRGALAVEILQQMAEGGNASSVVVRPELKIRASTADSPRV